jgi:hypothetical protein
MKTVSADGMAQPRSPTSGLAGSPAAFFHLAMLDKGSGKVGKRRTAVVA